MDEYRRHRGKARTIGLPFEVIGPDEIRRLQWVVDTKLVLSCFPQGGRNYATRNNPADCIWDGAGVNRFSTNMCASESPAGAWH